MLTVRYFWEVAILKALSLNGEWQFRSTTNDDWYTGQVPGSLLSDLYNLNQIGNPYYRDTEDKIYHLFKFDYEYVKNFEVSSSELLYESADLNFKGIDTIAEIYLNEQLIDKTSNMHRSHSFSVKDLLKEGENNLRVTFKSSINYIKEKNKGKKLYGIPMAIPGYTHLRKAHYMFGWDWGPQLPDCGLFRDVSLEFHSKLKLNDVYVNQIHLNNMVKLEVYVEIDNTYKKETETIINLTSPSGEVLKVKKVLTESGCIEIEIKEPFLWWPNGFGEQNLYAMSCVLNHEDFKVDRRDFKIGLRELTVNTDPDQWGSKFSFMINGINIFSMGANYIPEDNILNWTNPRRTEQLIRDCTKANFNTIRVWGGGLYPDDYFYELCDQYGLIVWQDFMFACGLYDFRNDDFIKESSLEIEDNVKRIRNHACIGLICGNNEIEMFFGDGRIEDTAENRVSYINFFENIIPKMVSELVPNIFYWPGSPSSGGNFTDTNGENHGDGHYWDVWHGEKPFTAFRDTYFRFMSEFGFESLPNIKTINSFTEEEDRNMFSYIMEKHQKDPSGNTKILTYLSNNYQNPKDFESLVYTSQILQAESIRYGVEHWRRHRGRCMGALYWQLNDCWPTVSWSSVDYYGRWKALHYAAKNFYSPVLLSAKEDETKIELYLTNDTIKEWAGQIKWSFISNKDGRIIESGSQETQIDKLSSMYQFTKYFPSNEDKRNVYFSYKLIERERVISHETVLFTPAKHFHFEEPYLISKFEEDDENIYIKLQSKSLAKFIELSLENTDVIFSNNYFDLPPNEEYLVTIDKQEKKEITSLNDIEKNLIIKSYFDSY